MARARCRALLTEAHARVEQVGHLRGLPLEDLTEDQHGALAGREVLQRRDEREPDRLPGGGDLGRVTVDGDDALVGDRLDEGVLGLGREDGGLDRRRRAEVHRPGSALGRAEHVDADVVGDPIEPRLHRRSAFEAIDRLPGPHKGLLHRVLGLGARAEHAVAVAGELAPVGLELVVEVDVEGGHRLPA